MTPFLASTPPDLNIFPCHPNTKTPATPHGFKDATHDPAMITAWWTQQPAYNVGIRTGLYEGRCLVVVDIDEHGISGTDAWHDITQGKHLPDTVECLTPRGGRHLYYWAWHEIRNSAAGNLPDGIDIRGEGGYVLAPPSTTSAGAYQWELEHHPDTTQIADMPVWLVELLTRTPPTQQPRTTQTPHTGTPRPGDLWAAATTWPDLLTPDGATYLGTRTSKDGPYEIWARPGLGNDKHTSATLYYGGTDLLKIHSSNWPNLNQGATYTKLGYLTHTRHGGDYHAASAWCVEQGYRHMDDTTPGTPSDDPDTSIWVDWHEFWNTDDTTSDWLVEPIIPRGRMTAISAPAKAGKSVLALEIAAAVATGRPCLHQSAGPPQHVCYFDLEMTSADLMERLSNLGYSDDDDLSYLHYAIMPNLPGLDTPAGGKAIIDYITDINPALVVFDTMARVVAGKENDADTYRNFYRWTAIHLKAQHITILRLDHTGKDLEKGQRGSSEKAGDVDLVWQMTVTGDDPTHTVTMKATHRRVTWVPAQVILERTNDPLVHKAGVKPGWPAGTKDCADQLDILGVPLTASANACGKALKAVDKGVRRAVVLAAQKYRKQRDKTSWNDMTSCRVPPQNGVGTDPVPDSARYHTSETASDQPGTTSGTSGTTQRVTNPLLVTHVVGTTRGDRNDDWLSRLQNSAQTTRNPIEDEI